MAKSKTKAELELENKALRAQVKELEAKVPPPEPVDVAFDALPLGWSIEDPAEHCLILSSPRYNDLVKLAIYPAEGFPTTDVDFNGTPTAEELRAIADVVEALNKEFDL